MKKAKKPQHRNVLSVCVTDEQREKLLKYAAEQDYTISHFMRRILILYIQHREEQDGDQD